MTNYTFSPSRLTFYDNVSKEQYENAGNWPNDPVEVTDEVFSTFTGDQPENKQLGQLNGYPSWVDTPAPTDDQIVAQNTSIQDGLVSDAKAAMFLTQTKLLLGKASTAEKEYLAQWLAYTDKLYAVNLKKPTWPEAPAS